MNEKDQKDLGALCATAVDSVPCSVPTDTASHAVPKRPSRSAPEIRTAAAIKIADELLSERPDDFSHEERESMIRDLRDAIGFGDGYEMARDLEHQGWCPDSELVQKLDGGSHLHRAYEEAIKTWVVRNQIHPAFEVGDRVVFDGYKGRDYSKKVPIEGEIARVERFRAQYVIFVESEGHVREGLGTHGTYINFEDVRQAGNGNKASSSEIGSVPSEAQK